MKKNVIVNFLKGMCIGGTMTVPGISGGSMAMILGIYDKLISSVNRAVKFDKKSIIFLLEVLLGGGIGIILFSGLVLKMIELYTMPVTYFFIGAVLGGTPMIYRSAKVTKFTPSAIIYPIIGIVIVSLIALLPEGVFDPSLNSGVRGFFIQIIGGVIIAIALVLPGISVSQMLLMLGLYETVMGAASSLNILPIIPIAVGALIGTLSTAKVMDKAMVKFPQATYLIIFGFVLGSVRELFPGVPFGFEIPLCILTAALGFYVVYLISEKS